MSQELKFDCPFCDRRGKFMDTRKNLNVKLPELIYNCFRCGARPSADGPLPQFILDQIGDRMFSAEMKGPKIYPVPQTQSIFECPTCLAYLQGRGFKLKKILSELDEAPLVCFPRWIGHRIGFKVPLRTEKGGYWYQGRTTENKEPKYFGTQLPASETSTPFLSGGIEVRMGGHPGIVLVEGGFDWLNLVVHKVTQVVCMWGKSFCQRKLEQLQAMKIPRAGFTILFDRVDTIIEQQRWAWEISKFAPVRTYQITSQASDPGTMDDKDIRAFESWRSK